MMTLFVYGQIRVNFLSGNVLNVTTVSHLHSWSGNVPFVFVLNIYINDYDLKKQQDIHFVECAM